MSGGGASNSPSASDSTTIVAAASLLIGHFAFLFDGFDANGKVGIAGSINVDSAGKVTGEEDFKDPATQSSTPQAVTGTCVNVAVSVGTCRLNAGARTALYDWNLRSNLFVARVAEDPSDAPNGCGSGTTGSCGSGVLIGQQVPTGNPTLGQWYNGLFDFSFVGTDGATPAGRIAAEGVFFTDGNGNITPQPGTLSQGDINDNGTLIQPSGANVRNVIGSMTPVDAFGRVTMTMTICTTVTAGAPAACDATQRVLNLAVYIVAPIGSTTNNNPGRAFAVDITPVNTSKQVLSGELFWQGNPAPAFSISGTNVFWSWGVVPGTPATSNTTIGTFTPSAVSFDQVSGGQVNGGGPNPLSSPLSGIVNSITFANTSPNNGRALLTTTVAGKTYVDVLYLDAPNDGSLLGATIATGGGAPVPDTTVTFGDFTGQATPTTKFNNTNVSGTYASGTVSPMLAAVPNGVSPVTLTPTGQNGQNGPTFSGNFTSGSSAGTYSFSQTTGRGIATANSGQIFQNGTAVFYLVTPNLIVIMGADPGDVHDAIGLIQF